MNSGSRSQYLFAKIAIFLFSLIAVVKLLKLGLFNFLLVLTTNLRKNLFVFSITSISQFAVVLMIYNVVGWHYKTRYFKLFLEF